MMWRGQNGLRFPRGSPAALPLFGRRDSGGSRSAFARAFGRLRRGAGAHLVLDALADTGIHILPILECAAEHRLADAAREAAGDLVDQLLALRIVSLPPAIPSSRISWNGTFQKVCRCCCYSKKLNNPFDIIQLPYNGLAP